MAILAYDEVMLREPRLLVPRSVPIGRCRIDWSNPLARDLKVFVVAGQGDLVTGLQPQFGGTARLTPKLGNLSYQSQNNNNDCAYFAFPAGAPLYTIKNTHAMMLAFDHSSSANYANFVSVPFAAGTWAEPYNSLVLYKNSQHTNNWQYQYATGSSPIAAVRSTGAVQLANKSIIASYQLSNKRIYVDGVDVTGETDNDNNDINWSTKQPLCILAASNSYSVNAGVTGNAYCCGIWGRDLTPAEARSLYLDPYQFLIPA